MLQQTRGCNALGRVNLPTMRQLYTMPCSVMCLRIYVNNHIYIILCGINTYIIHSHLLGEFCTPKFISLRDPCCLSFKLPRAHSSISSLQWVRVGKSVKPQTHKQAFLPKSHHTRPGFNHQGLVQPWALEAKFLPKSKGVAWLPELFLNSNSNTLWWIAHPCSTHFLATRLFCFGMEKKTKTYSQITWVLRHPHNIPTASGPFVVFVWVKPSPKMSRLLAGFRARNFWKKTRGVSVYPVMERGNPESPPTSTCFGGKGDL